MIDLLTQNIVWWHWVSLGILLIILEINTGTFYLLGFGLASMVVGLTDLLFGMSFNIQLILWMTLAVIITAVLFKYFKKEPDVSNIGQSNQGLGTEGVVTEKILSKQRGEVRFDRPVLGNTIWRATSDVDINIGTRIIINEVRGQLIKVSPVS